MVVANRHTEDRRRANQAVSVDRRKTDRRETPRLPIELWMEEIAGDDVYFRRTGNVSEGGVYFDRAIPHARGTYVTLKFTLPGDREMVVARAQVVNTTEGSNGLGMGLKLISLEGDGHERLRRYLRRL